MIVAGFGFRAGATAASLRAALAAALDEALAAGDCGPGARAGPAAELDQIACVADKAEAAGLVALAQGLGLVVRAVPLADLAAQPCVTLSPRQPARYGVASVAEAAALAAAGPGARLLVARRVSPDGRATVAIAKGAGG